MKINKNITVIGTGKIGQTIIKALLDARMVNATNVTGTAGHQTTLDIVSSELGINTTLDNVAACRNAEIIFLCVKPQLMATILKTLHGCITENQLVISTAASTSTSNIEQYFNGKIPVIRTMPNTPCLIRQGMTAISAGKNATKIHIELAKKIFDTLGRSIVLDEKHIDAVTGMSGCGPAFMYMIVEALAEGGVMKGLPRDVATLLAAQTMMGSGAMTLQTGAHPAVLKDAVTTPAGCTIDGILALEEGGLRVTLIKAVARATERAQAIFRESLEKKNNCGLD